MTICVAIRFILVIDLPNIGRGQIFEVFGAG